jgi:hypothetical protein
MSQDFLKPLNITKHIASPQLPHHSPESDSVSHPKYAGCTFLRIAGEPFLDGVKTPKVRKLLEIIRTLPNSVKRLRTEVNLNYA